MGHGKKRVQKKIEQDENRSRTHTHTHTVRDFDLRLTEEPIQMSGEKDRRGVEERERWWFALVTHNPLSL